MKRYIKSANLASKAVDLVDRLFRGLESLLDKIDSWDEGEHIIWKITVTDEDICKKEQSKHSLAKLPESVEFRMLCKVLDNQEQYQTWRFDLKQGNDNSEVVSDDGRIYHKGWSEDGEIADESDADFRKR